MSPLESAVAELEEEIAAFGPGSSRSPKPGTAEFFRLRALAVAHSWLNRVKALQIETDPAACERLYRAGASHFSKALPPEVPAEKEELSDAQRAQISAALAARIL